MEDMDSKRMVRRHRKQDVAAFGTLKYPDIGPGALDVLESALGVSGAEVGGTSAEPPLLSAYFYPPLRAGFLKSLIDTLQIL